MPETREGATSSTPPQREDARPRARLDQFSMEEREAAQEMLEDALSRVRFPARKREIASALRRSGEARVSHAAVTTLPDRRYESAEDVKYTLDALDVLQESPGYRRRT